MNQIAIAASQWNYSTRPGAPSLSLYPFYRTSGLKTMETSCLRIDDSVSNIPYHWRWQLLTTCHWPLVIPVVLWHSCHCLNVRGLFDPIIISSQANSLRTSPGWSEITLIVIICIKCRKDQHENRKHPWDKVLRMFVWFVEVASCRGVCGFLITLLPSIYLVIAKRSVRKSLILASAVSVLC